MPVVVRRRKKTLEVETRLTESGIRVIIGGDFFAYPPETIDEIEKALSRSLIDAAEAAKTMKKFKNKVKLVGIKFDDLVEAVAEAIKQLHSM